MLEKGGDLTGEALELALRLGAVREARRVAKVDEILGRQSHQALVQHRQAADARVEHADGQGAEGGLHLRSAQARALAFVGRRSA